MATFKTLKINEQFTYNEQTWIKVIPVKKGSRCCGKVLYNGYLVSDQKTQRIFKPNDEVGTI